MNRRGGTVNLPNQKTGLPKPGQEHHGLGTKWEGLCVLDYIGNLIPE
jgi:hypothetical protein